LSTFSASFLAEMSEDQDGIGLNQDYRQFRPDQDWIELQFFEDWQIRTESDWDNFCCFYGLIPAIWKRL